MKRMESDETKIAVLVEKVSTMSVILSKLDTKMDTITDKFFPREQGIDLEKRVTSLEGWKIWLVGAAAGIAVIVSFVKDLIIKH